MIDDPRVRVDTYLVVPTGYDDFVNSDKITWCLAVTDGHEWGWSIRRAAFASGAAMNRRGEWIYERRGHGGNRFRRFPLDEALTIALAHVDTHRMNGYTAVEASAWVAGKETDDGQP